MMDTSDVVQAAAIDPASAQAVLNVGMALREAREAQGMSVHDIAERIKFAPRQVEALESNDFEHLPKATFLRGFVRSYARVLQLDEAALIAALPAESSPQTAVRQPIVDVSFPGWLALRRVNILWLAGALGIAVILGLFAWLADSEPVEKQSEVVVEPVQLPATDASISAVAAPQTLAPSPEATKAPVLAKVPEQRRAAESAQAKPVVATPSPIAEIKPAIKETPVVAAASSPATEAQQPVPLELLKRRPLHFVFSGIAWIEVIDVNGTILLSRTNQPGTEKWIGGPRRAPYDISIGNPANVKLYYRGKEIDLSPYASMKIAHLKVE
ncbi:MAG: helix-turn-helix domain-containing protein [Nitrosomonadales bacterium]|nr:helix-turn-helix domain-containing protein [Nitrosomonadales bacterium]